MRILAFSLLVSQLATVAATSAYAQDAGPALPQEAASPPAEKPVPAPTLESLQTEIQSMKAQHDADLQQLRDEQALREADALVNYQQEAAERERLLRIYGFADVGVKRTTTPKDGFTGILYSSPLSFTFGRLNLYFDSQPDPDFRFLAETRFSTYPNGSFVGASSTGQVNREYTTVFDINSINPGTSVAWGGIILERAVLDWKRYDLFSVRTGLFLSPFGIYNVDHGTPTLISVTQPIYISQGWIPERQLGIQIFGSYFVKHWELGYAATISNGRTEDFLDVGDSKAFGGRLLAKRKGDLKLQLGASAIYQPYRRNTEQLSFDATGTLTYSSKREVESRNLTMGVDLSLDYFGLRVRTEYVRYHRDYLAGKRLAPPRGLGGFEPDMRANDWFLVVAYRAWKIEPFMHSELFWLSPAVDVGNGAWVATPGVNFYLRSSVILKGCWAYVKFFKDDDPQDLVSRQNFQMWSLLLTWAF